MRNHTISVLTVLVAAVLASPLAAQGGSVLIRNAFHCTLHTREVGVRDDRARVAIAMSGEVPDTGVRSLTAQIASLAPSSYVHIASHHSNSLTG